MTLLRRATTSAGGPAVAVEPPEAGLQYVHFAAHYLAAGTSLQGQTGVNEMGLIVLGGQCSVDVEGAPGSTAFPAVGQRPDVWSVTPASAVLLPPGCGYAVEAQSAVHLAVAGARVGAVASRSASPPRFIEPHQVTVEQRGEGQTHRRVHHLLPPSAQAARLILVEVYTPGGNWSSFPPHKHDTESPPEESFLEEVYYFQVRPATGFALLRIYTPDRALDETLAPGTGDLVLVPRGFHPVAATPGHECYYLNVMAGPTRAWNFRVDPHYAHLMNWHVPPVAAHTSPSVSR